MSCLGCQHFISDWLGKLKPNKLSTGCQNELKGAAVEKAANPGRRFLFFSRLRRTCARLDKTAMLCRLGQAFLAETVESGDKNRDDFHCLQMSLEMSMPFIFGDD